MEIVIIDVEGADQSLVIAGTDATSSTEPIGLTLAEAVVDSHLFMALSVRTVALRRAVMPTSPSRPSNSRSLSSDAETDSPSVGPEGDSVTSRKGRIAVAVVGLRS